MDKRNKLEDILFKSKQIFINEQKSKIEDMMAILLEYRLYKRIDHYEVIKRFFHSLKGAGATLQFEELSSIGGEYEELLTSIEGLNSIDDEVFSKLLMGFARAYSEIKKIQEDFLIKDSLLSEVAIGEYTNITRTGNILIIDNDVSTLNILEKTFLMEGYYVTITSDPGDIMNIIKNRDADMIILNNMMPQMDGLEVLREIKKENTRIPVIFLSEKSFGEDKVRAFSNGVDDYIIKPFDVREVVARVERVLQREESYKATMIEDELTGVYTRKHFNTRIQEALERLNRMEEKFSVAFVDIDGLKEINDTYGNLAGDFILKTFADKLKKTTRKMDQVYRFGGDEFLVLFPNCSCKGSLSVFNRLKKGVEEEKIVLPEGRGEVKLSFSAGVYTVNDKNEGVDDILDKANKALYKVKSDGKDNVICYIDDDSIQRKNRKILLIDDEKVILKLIQTRLSSIEYDVYNATDGERGIEIAEAINPDLVVIDIMLPKISGFEVCKAIKNNPRTKNTKLIILSSRKRDEDIVKSFELGVDDYITKPFSLSDLQIRIERLLNN